MRPNSEARKGLIRRAAWSPLHSLPCPPKNYFLTLILLRLPGKRHVVLFSLHLIVSRQVLAEQFRLGPATAGDLTLLLTAIQVTSKFIATNVRKARLINL